MLSFKYSLVKFVNSESFQTTDIFQFPSRYMNVSNLHASQ